MHPASPLDVRIRQRLAEVRGRILIAYSGGRDSSVLLHALAAPAELRSRLVAVHADHGLHPDSPRWAEHCGERAGALGVAFVLRKLKVAADSPEGMEAAARRARYQVLGDLLEPGDCLVTAHHARDQLETLLLRLFRGSGTRGLAGIREWRELGRGELRRPMLEESEAVLADYAGEHGLSWIEDPGNRDLDRDRNYLRRVVLPRIERRWPAAAETAARGGRRLAEDAELLDALAGLDRGEAGSGPLPRERLSGLSPARQRNLLRVWWAEQTGQPPSAGVLERILSECLDAAPDAQPELRLGEWCLRRGPDALVLEPVAAGQSLPAGRKWPDPQDRPLELAGLGRLRLLRDEGGEISPALLDAELWVGFRRGGERFHDGRHHRRLAEWLRGQRLPAHERDRLPLLWASGRLVAAGEQLLDPAWRRGPGQAGMRLVWEAERANLD